MPNQHHSEITAKIREIANRLRGPYRPPQCRLVMLPMVVLRRLDCVLAAALAKARELKTGTSKMAIHLLTRVVDQNHKQIDSLHNTRKFTFERLLGDSENIAPNLSDYIQGFSENARHIFEKFTGQIEKLDTGERAALE